VFVLVGQTNRANLRTISTGSTLVDIDIPRLLVKRYRKVSFGTLDIFYFGIGNQIDIDMPADLDQFR
jgi:hypothetical protein